MALYSSEGHIENLPGASDLPTELCAMICKELRDQLDRKALFALVQTCKKWSEPALDALWRCMDDVKPLLNLVPHHALANRNNGRTPADRGAREAWARFDEYSKRVTTLYTTFSEQRCEDYSTILQLAALRGSPILPRLKTFDSTHLFRCLPLDARLVPALSAFLAPSLETLYISIEGDPLLLLQDGSELRGGHFHIFLQNLPAKVPRLKTFQITQWDLPHVPLDFIGGFRSLENLELDHIPNDILSDDVMRSDLFNAFSCLPCLKDLTIRGVLKHAGNIPVGAPPVLERLCTEDIMPSALAEILRRMHSDTLQSIEMNLPRAIALVNGMHSLCQAISTFHPMLRSIRIFVQHVEDTDPPGIPIFAVFGPLLELRHLEDMTICPYHVDQDEGTPCYAIRDNDIKEMISAWPKLQNLHLQWYIDEPLITFNSLVIIATSSRLRRLELEHIYIGDEVVEGEIPTTSHQLYDLWLNTVEYESDKCNAEVLKGAVRRLFPSLGQFILGAEM